MIDAAATMNNGEKVADIVAFKKMLLRREEDVMRCLAEKMLAYASGRVLEVTDRGEVDRIVEELKGQRQGLRELVKLVVQSDVFLTK